MKILEAIYNDSTTPQWLKMILAIETLRIAWVHQYWIDNGQLHWRSHQDLPSAGLRSNSPYDIEARYGNKRHTTWLGYKVHLTETAVLTKDPGEKRKLENLLSNWEKLKEISYQEISEFLLSAEAD